MKQCENCEFCESGEYGEIECAYEKGREFCPFMPADTKVCDNENGAFNITIDGAKMEGYIKSVIAETTREVTANIVNLKIDLEIQRLAKSVIEPVVEKYTEDSVKQKIAEQVNEFLAGEITVGGGWCEPTRTLSREQYLNDTVKEYLGKTYQSDVLKKSMESIACKKIDMFERELKNDINRNIEQCFTEATRKILADNVVNLLMSSETYQKLSATMGNLLPTSK